MPARKRPAALLLAAATLLSATLLSATLLSLPAEQPQPVRASAFGSYAEAQRLRSSLDLTPPARRSPQAYQRVIDAYRAVYHSDRTAPNADSSVEAVAELLAEEGRLFHDPTLLRSAVEQLDFLRRDFAASPYSVPALLTQGEIEARDLHETDAARTRFSQFLAGYPRSPLAPQARAELRRLGGSTPASEAVQQPTLADTRRAVTPPEADFGIISAPPAVPRPAASRPAPPRPTAPTSAARQGALTEQDIPPATPPPISTREPSNPAQAPTPAPAQTLPPPSLPTRSATSIVGGVPIYRPANTHPPNAAADHLARVTGVRHWSTANYTRVAVDLGDEVPFEASRVSNPDRIFFDLHNARLAPELAGKAVTVTDGGFLERIRAAQFSGDVVRVVLDVSDVSDYSAFWLPNPSRLIIDIHGRPRTSPAAPSIALVPGQPGGTTLAQSSSAPASPPRPAEEAAARQTPSARAAAAGNPTPRQARAAAPGTFVSQTVSPAESQPASPGPGFSPGAGPDPGSSATPHAGESVAAIAALSQQPSRVRATRAPTTAPVAVVSAPAAPRTPNPPIQAQAPTPAATPQPALPAATPPPTTTASTLPPRRKSRRTATPDTVPPATAPPAIPGEEARAAEPDSMGGRSMVRALGLKINRIVVDAGHGGHDSGTLGPGGIEEKDVVLDVALRLGKLLKQRLGADVIYTRDDDTFIPLETRTAIANKAQADLFISVHANSSPDASARGVETYYLNFTTSADALEVAARENAVSSESIHQLSDLVKKITLQDKIAESREFATDVEGSLYQGLSAGNDGLKDRGVKKAPFVVLIGANMPSILAEISFLTNPADASELRDSDYRQRIAESLYKGVARYVRSLSGSAEQPSAGTR